ncbi:MAG: hypothetical protein ACPHO0_02065 [Luminiphilus sp.]
MALAQDTGQKPEGRLGVWCPGVVFGTPTVKQRRQYRAVAGTSHIKHCEEKEVFLDYWSIFCVKKTTWLISTNGGKP